MKKVYFIVLVVLISCTSNEPISFYEYSMVTRDVWRLPVIEPYELITADCCTGWNFSTASKLGELFKESFSIDSLNYDKGYVIFVKTFSGDKWRIARLEDKETFQFETYNEFDSFRSEHGITDKLYSGEEAHNYWKENGELPWQDQIGSSSSSSGGE